MKKKHRVNLRMVDDSAIIGLDVLEIWDGADLIILREALASLIEYDGHLSIGVDVSSVMHIPSGFFGMLFEWYESGVEVLLYGPGTHIRNMYWFRMFFREHPHRKDIFRLTDVDVRNHTPNQQEEYHRREFSKATIQFPSESPTGRSELVSGVIAVAESDLPWRDA